MLNATIVIKMNVSIAEPLPPQYHTNQQGICACYGIVRNTTSHMRQSNPSWSYDLEKPTYLKTFMYENSVYPQIKSFTLLHFCGNYHYGRTKWYRSCDCDRLV